MKRLHVGAALRLFCETQHPFPASISFLSFSFCLSFWLLHHHFVHAPVARSYFFIGEGTRSWGVRILRPEPRLPSLILLLLLHPPGICTHPAAAAATSLDLVFFAFLAVHSVCAGSFLHCGRRRKRAAPPRAPRFSKPHRACGLVVSSLVVSRTSEVLEHGARKAPFYGRTSVKCYCRRSRLVLPPPAFVSLPRLALPFSLPLPRFSCGFSFSPFPALLTSYTSPVWRQLRREADWEEGTRAYIPRRHPFNEESWSPCGSSAVVPLRQ